MKDNLALKRLQQLPNVGPAMAKDLLLLGITDSAQLVSRDPDQMWEELCVKTGVRHDPCVRDVFESVIAFANGKPAQPWWAFTEGRKKRDQRP
jgi:hypothetical protein